jgi:hypothetical protein
MKRTKGIPPLSPDATDDEMIEWTEKYDLGARLDAGVSEVIEIHEPSPHAGRTTELTLRLPSTMKAALQKLARQRTTDAPTLARRWIAERLQQELKDQSL